MKFGVVFPSTAIGNDPVFIRDFVQAVAGMGFDYLLTYETIIDTRSDDPPESWFEPFSLLSFVAGVAPELELATGIVVLPSRQTILVAKQAAQIDILSQGKFRLGVSAGWNDQEYAVMGVPFAERGKRLDDQIRLLRRLWTEPFPKFDGDFHTLEDISIIPRPIQQPIPIWLGGYAESVLKRIGELGDGWIIGADKSPESLKSDLEKIKQYALATGRDPSTIGVNVTGVDVKTPRDWGKLATEWRDAGTDYLDITTPATEFTTLQQHLNAIRNFKENATS